MVELRGIGHRIGDVRILDGVSVDFRPGRFNVILGPNGAGKSTLLRIAAGLMRPSAGEVLYDGERVDSFDAERLARRRAMLSQHTELAFPLAARDVVLMGRYPHYQRVPRAVDRDVVRHTLELVGMSAKASQSYDTLSGGERQKVQLARVLAQIGVAADGSQAAGESRVLFLDEPTNNLDVHYQLWLLDLARALVADDCTVVAILHDLNVALEYGEHFLLLHEGRVALEAEHADDISQEIVEGVFRVSARRMRDSESERAWWRFSR